MLTHILRVLRNESLIKELLFTSKYLQSSVKCSWQDGDRTSAEIRRQQCPRWNTAKVRSNPYDHDVYPCLKIGFWYGWLGFRSSFWVNLKWVVTCPWIPNSLFPPKIRSFLKPKREGSDWHCRSSCWPSLTIRPGHSGGEEKGDGLQLSIQSSRPSSVCLSVFLFSKFSSWFVQAVNQSYRPALWSQSSDRNGGGGAGLWDKKSLPHFRLTGFVGF